MTLLIAVFAAVITTIIWYTNDKRSQLKLGTLALMYWGASLMWIGFISGSFRTYHMDCYTYG